MAVSLEKVTFSAMAEAMSTALSFFRSNGDPSVCAFLRHAAASTVRRSTSRSSFWARVSLTPCGTASVASRWVAS
jgi:hypothetical protein